MLSISTFSLLFAIPIILCSFGISLSQGQIYQEAVLVVSSKEADPFLRLKKDVNVTEYPVRTTHDYEGYAWDLADLVSRQLGYHSFKLVIADSYGRPPENATDVWGGMVGAVEREEVHVGIGPLTITKERSKVIDFSQPFLQFQLGILLSKDGPSSNGDDDDDDEDDARDHDGQFLFLDPFTPFLWIVIVGIAIILLFVIFFIEKFVSLKQQGDERSKKEKLFHHFCSRVFGTPRSLATRILQISFWIWLIVIFSSYVANFAANRVIDLIQDHENDDEDELKIKSLDDLLKDEDVQYGTLRGGSTYKFFEKSQNEVYKKMFEEMTKDDTFVDDIEDGIEMVENGNGTFALIGETPTLKYSTLQQPCNLVLAPKEFGPKIGFGIATPKKNLQMTRLINRAILELKEKGHLEDLERKWFTDRTQCPDDEDDDDDWSQLKLNEHEPLDLASMAGVFYFLLIAIAIFFVIAAVELRLIAKFKQQ